MKETLILTIPHNWINLENFETNARILTDIVQKNSNRKIVIISGIIDHGYSLTRGNIKKSGIDLETRQAVSVQADRYLSICLKYCKSNNIQWLTDRLDEVKKIIHQKTRHIWKTSGIISSIYADVSAMLYREILSCSGVTVTEWPKNTLFNKSIRQIALNNATTIDRVFKYMRFDGLPPTSVIIPSFGVTLSGVEISLEKESLEEFKMVLLSVMKNKSFFRKSFPVVKIVNIDHWQDGVLQHHEEELAVA